MTYKVTKSIDIDFAHNVYGHSGPCISIHGHTWKFEVSLEASTLDKEGFVIDFKKLKQRVLEPIHKLLDHGYGVFIEQALAREAEDIPPPFITAIENIARVMMASRMQVHGTCEGSGRWLFQYPHTEPLAADAPMLNGAFDLDIGGLKVILFPFPPTSERLAEWLWGVAAQALVEEGISDRVRCVEAKVYETLHPVESVASFVP